MKRVSLLSLTALAIITVAIFLGTDQPPQEHASTHANNQGKDSPQEALVQSNNNNFTTVKSEPQQAAPDSKLPESETTPSTLPPLWQLTPSSSLNTQAAAIIIPNLQEGDILSFPLPDGSNATARVNLVQNDEGTFRVGASILENPHSSLALAFTPSHQLYAQIISHETETAIIITPEGEDESRVKIRPLSEILCTRYPVDDTPTSDIIDLSPSLSMHADAAPRATVPILSSRPSATAVVYLDFDGATVNDPRWNEGKTIIAAPSHLNTTEINYVWKRVAEDFAPFNIDITTNASRYNNAPVGKRMRVIITTTNWYSDSAGGVAYVGSFAYAGTPIFSETIPCWVFQPNANSIALSTSHEVGHTLGLDHDGTTIPAEEYFRGHGVSPMKWRPIMGSGFDSNVIQWSKGEYLNATNQQDDLAIITGEENGFGYIPDTAGNSRQTAAILYPDDEPKPVKGIIIRETDIDYYSFNLLAECNVTIYASPAEFDPNLDILLELQDANGNKLAESNPLFSLGASITMTLPSGNYYISIQGTGYGDPLTNGYPAYGSIGQYTITTTGISEAVPPTNLSTLPTTLSLTEGYNTTLKASAVGYPPPTFHWEVSMDGGSTWRRISDNDHFSGSASDTLRIRNTDPSMSGWVYRFVASNKHGSQPSNTSTITVAPAPAESTWINPDAGDWMESANWSHGIPGRITNVLIPQGEPTLGGDIAALSGIITMSGSIAISDSASLQIDTLILQDNATLKLKLAAHPTSPIISVSQSLVYGPGTQLQIDTDQIPNSTKPELLYLPLIQYPPANGRPGDSINSELSTFDQNGILYLVLPPTADELSDWLPSNPGLGDWHNHGSWLNGVPSGAALINKGSPAVSNNSSLLNIISANSSTSTGNLILTPNATLFSYTLNLSQNGSGFMDNEGNLSIAGDAFISYDSGSDARIINKGIFSSGRSIVLGTHGHASITNTGNISANSTLRIARNGTAELLNTGNISAKEGIHIAQAPGSEATVENTGNISTEATLFLGGSGIANILNIGNISGTNLYLAQDGTANINNDGAIHAKTIHIAHNPSSSANITLHPYSTLSTETLTIANSGSADITIQPQASLTSNTLIHSANGTLRYLLTPESSLSLAPIRITESAPQLFGELAIDSRAITDPVIIPLLKTIPQGNPSLPPHSILSSSGTDAYIAWDDTGSLLLFHIVPAGTGPSPLPDTDEQRLIYAFTDNYSTNPDGSLTTKGDLSYLPKTHLSGNNKFAITFTPLRSEYLYEVQQSFDLKNWTTISASTGGEASSVTVESNYGPGTNPPAPMIFLRIKVSEKP